MPIDKYKEFKKFGADGGKQKGINYKTRRQELLDKLEPEVDPMFFNLIRSRIKKNDELERTIKFLNLKWKK